MGKNKKKLIPLYDDIIMDDVNEPPRPGQREAFEKWLDETLPLKTKKDANR